jgi:hypothetical protein
MLRRAFPRAVLLVIALTLGSAASALAQAPTGDNARRVMALREVTLKNGASAQEFEKYFSEVYARTMAERIPGLQVYLLRGERGERQGKYVMVYELDSLARRNEYWPQPDVASERITQLTQNMPQFEFDKHLEAGSGNAYTDYLVLKP